MIHSTLKYFMVVSDFKYQRIKTNANISNRLDCIDGKIFYFHTSQYYRLQTKFGARYCFYMCLSVHRWGCLYDVTSCLVPCSFWEGCLCAWSQWWIQDFPKVRVSTLEGWGVPTYDFAKFAQKLHEIERILTLGSRVQNFTM